MTPDALSGWVSGGAPAWVVVVLTSLIALGVFVRGLRLPELLDALNRWAARRAALNPGTTPDLRAAALDILRARAGEPPGKIGEETVAVPPLPEPKVDTNDVDPTQ